MKMPVWSVLAISLVLFIHVQPMFLPGSAFAQRVNRETDETVMLENEYIRITLGKNRPSVHEYFLKTRNVSLPGDISGGDPRITFFRGVEGVMRTRTSITYNATHTAAQSDYHARVAYDNNPAVEFDLIYSLTEDGLAIDFKNVVEHGEFRLIHIQLPRLVSIKDDGGTARLAIPADCGRLVDIRTASHGEYEYDINWLNAILAGMVYDSKVLGLIDTESVENHTVAGVFARNGITYGSLSMNIIHRLKDYDLAEFGTILPVTDPKYLLKVQDACRIMVSVGGDYNRDGEISWVDGAKMLGDRVDAVSNPYYKDKTFIRAFLDRPGSSQYMTFAEVLRRIKELAHQTEAPACVLYLLGWQYEGHDSGYPSVDKVNERLGGYDGLVNLIQEAKKYNVNVTFHDNYDDSYPTHPGWDPDVICRDSRGDLMSGGYWDGGQSFLISSYKYAVKSGLERVRTTLKQYPVSEAYFIDVLAGGYNGGRKYDFNPESPAGAEKNFEGKLMIIREFNRHGLDVATEDFTGFFVGHVGSFGNIIDLDNVYFRNEERIPLIPFIYHDKTSYGMKVGGDAGELRQLLYGQRAESFTNNYLVFTASDYILHALPKQKLYGKAMKAFRKNGDIERVTYEDGSYVEVHYGAMRYTVCTDGRVIAKDFTSFVPIKKDVFLACSRDGGCISYPAPEGWNSADRIHVYRMNADGSTHELPFELFDGNLEFSAEPQAPYKVVYE